MHSRIKSILLAAAVVAAPVGISPVFAKEPSVALDLARQLNQAFIEVASGVSDSVVVISVAHKPDFTMQEEEDNPFWEQFRRQFEERFRQRKNPHRAPVFDAMGSGVVLREDGYILTNRHVVDGADKIRVRLKNGKEYDAEVRGVDAQSDIAVIKIDAKGLPAAKMADSDKSRVGEFAIAIGAPFELDYSVTFGHVSAKGRSRVIPDPSADQDFIQTDANINPGNSGGPLVNIDGEVIGINTMIKGLHTGIGFAIPSNLAKEVAERLIADGKFTRAWLGIEIRALSEDAEYRDMVKGVDDGVVVRGIRQDGPAANSDLKVGDIITTVEGKKVSSAQALRSEIRSRKIGSPVTLDVVRGGKNVKIKVKPGEWPDEERLARSTERKGAEAAGADDLGISVKQLNKDLAKELGTEVTEGLVVAQVEPDSVAARKGVAKGDVVIEVNQKPVGTIKEFKNVLRDTDLKKGVMLTLVSQGVTKLVILKDSGD